MRVVAGLAKGRRLKVPAGRRIRPTSEVVREALMSSLGSLGAIEGARVVDLFAGSGALGIEALSRGAASVTFVDADPAAAAVIRENLTATGLTGGTVVQADVFRFSSNPRQNGGRPPRPEAAPTRGRSTDDQQRGFGIDGAGAGEPSGPARRPGEAFDLALADPPYDFERWADLLAVMPAPLAALEWRRTVPSIDGWETIRTRHHGDSVFTLVRRVEAAVAASPPAESECSEPTPEAPLPCPTHQPTTQS
ncbi:MAG: RsmD family RNA methyltransferase [Acidimicrobiales bacterium]